MAATRSTPMIDAFQTKPKNRRISAKANSSTGLSEERGMQTPMPDAYGLFRLAAGDAHMASDSDRRPSTLINEIMAFGLPPDRFIDGSREELIIG